MKRSPVCTRPKFKSPQSPNNQSERPILTLARPQLSDIVLGDQLSQSCSNFRLHTKEGFRGRKTLHTNTPAGKLRIGLTKKTRYMTKSFFEDKSSNLYDLTTQMAFPPQFFYHFPEAKEKKERVLSNLNGCLNARKILSNSKLSSSSRSDQIPLDEQEKKQDTVVLKSCKSVDLGAGKGARILKKKSSFRRAEGDEKGMLLLKNHSFLPFIPSNNLMTPNSNISAQESLSVQTMLIRAKSISNIRS